MKPRSTQISRMDADWSVACAAGDPMIVIPWNDEHESERYIDLRAEPEGLQQIPAASQYPALAAALRSWNRPGSPVFTAKCDVWNYAADAFDSEDLPGFEYAHACYIDLLAADAAAFASFDAGEQALRAWTTRARAIEMPTARCEWTLRPAIIQAGKELAGFATTLYVWGYGETPASAAVAWSAALLALVAPVQEEIPHRARSSEHQATGKPTPMESRPPQTERYNNERKPRPGE